MKTLNRLLLILFIPIFLSSCGGGFKLPKPGDARNIPSDGRERARKNIEEGRGISLQIMNLVLQIHFGEQRLM